MVVIGRNEGERLKRCIASIADVHHRVYVDSASSDGSVEYATGQGMEVVPLSSPPKMTAARGRNAGLARLGVIAPGLDYIQLVDGDCEVQPEWLETAARALDADPGLGLVFGRRRERFPERTLYNALCDDEWNVPVGEALECGGDILCRVEAIRAIGGYDETMIAGEDPDMSTRMRKEAWRLARIDAEMTLHDADIRRFGQWWRRSQRAGHAFAELAHRHAGMRNPDRRRTCRKILAWGGVFPLAVLTLAVAGLFAGWPAWLAALALVAGWLLNMARLGWKRRGELPTKVAMASGALLMAGKFPEMLGLAQFHLRRVSGKQSQLIEYKGASPA